MSDVPELEIAASSTSLNQRFNNNKKNYALYVIAALLGVGLIVTVVIISNRGGDEPETAEEQGKEKEPVAVTAPKLSQSVFEQDLESGEVARIDIGQTISNAKPQDCQIDWQLKKTNVPQNVLKDIQVESGLVVSVPTTHLAGQSAEWQLVGIIKSKQATSEEFTIKIRAKVSNSPPILTSSTMLSFDPVLGASLKFTVGDKESDPSAISTTLIAKDLTDKELQIDGLAGNRSVRFVPAFVRRDEFVITIEATDEQGLTAKHEIRMKPGVQSESARLVEKLLSENGNELSESKVERQTARVVTTVKLSGASLTITESLGGLTPSLDLASTAEDQKVFQQGPLVARVSKEQSALAQKLRSILGDPVGVKPDPVVKSVKKTSQLLTTSRSLLNEKKLFQRQSFGELVRAYVKDFEEKNALVLGQKYSELSGLKDWLDKQQGFKAELFLALDPQVDNIPGALQVVDDLRTEFPQQIVTYKNLAIAIAVSWDRPRATYHYANHQSRTKSIMPENLVGPVENFKHFITYQNQMQGRAQWLPWEFLIHVVNHQTPETERYWALDQYLARRVNFGSCYKDVPYDYEMLNSGSRNCKLSGLQYTLANLRSAGGVCAMQADFAARVGKSLGVPSEYVGGASTSGENHAWVMWVEIKSVTKRSIAFSLESYGRYRGDNYYVGRLRDPKSGQMITDRQLELRLHTVGTDAYAMRQVDLLVDVYPELVTAEELDLKGQLKYLEQAIKLCPWHEGAWKQVARTISGQEIDQRMKRQMNNILNSMFVHFAAFPDFTWEIFDQLVSFVSNDKQKNQYYGKLINLYVSAKRPDLACEARLRLTSLLEEQDDSQTAMQGLAVTVKAFPDEGRYVPKLLDRLEKLCGSDPKMNAALVQFYAEFLPLVPQKRGNRPSKYCMKMYARAVQVFSERAATELANLYQAKLQTLQSL